MIARPLSSACLAAVVLLTAAPLRAAATRAEAVFGAALDTHREVAVAAPKAAYSQLPLTCELFARFDSAAAYNILIANETKASPTHWELFTLPGSGQLSAYLPGRQPDHVHTGLAICDGRWHWIQLVMEPARVRIVVDGAVRADVAATAPTSRPVPGELALGALPTGELQSSGWLDEVRLSRVARPVGTVPLAPLTADADTVALWHFGAAPDGRYADASTLANPAVIKARPVDDGPGRIAVAGTMSTAFQPLPPAEDVTSLRAELTAVAQRLELRSVDPGNLRDGVLRAWRYDLTWYGKVEYPGPRHRPVDPQVLAQQVYDQQALLLASDGGPAGTVLRRTAALLAHYQRTGLPPAAAAPAADLARLQREWSERRPAPGTDAHRALYLAACAVRRGLMLANPLLDFDGIAFVARGTFAGSARSNPSTQDVQGGHFATQYFGFNALPGGGLFIVRNYRGQPRIVNVLADSVVQNGRWQGQKLDHGAFATPDLSFDGRQLVFAWCANREHRWRWSRRTTWKLFTVNVDGSHLRQLTDGAVDDFDPCWLPDGRIAFVSERRGGHIRCFAPYLKVRNYTLFSMAADGSDIRPLSYYETSEWNPTVTNDGRLAYTRWDYTDRENCLGSRLWLSRPDGSDPRAPHGNYPLPYDTFIGHQPWQVAANGRERDSRWGSPMVEMGIRSVPNSPLYIATAAPHHGEVFGSLVMLDLRGEDDHHMSQLRRITPDEAFPESEMGGRQHYKYGSPWPLSEDCYLANAWENLVLLDRWGNQELLCELPLLPCAPDERLRLIDPLPLQPRPRPPVLTSQRSAVANQPATIAVMNVYDSDLPFPPGTRIKYLRVVQNFLKSNHAMGQPMIGYERENTPRVPLGVVPVEEDGSVYFEAPVAKELIFQALDEEHRAVQSMRSVAFVHPGEQLTCAGCHEPTNRSPKPAGRPLAMRRAPSKLQPELGAVEPISYYRQVKPIIDRTCLPCHTKAGHGPQDMRYEALRDDYTFWFSGAMLGDMCSPYSGIHGGSRTIPGRFGTRHCRIGKALFDQAHRAAVKPAERHTMTVWLDCNSLRLGAFEREEAQLRGELVWPELDVDPRNPVGTETTRPGLAGNFWHENDYGPHAVLAGSHSRQAVFIRDATGRIVWEYPAQNPQEVWLLPNGNVLFAWLHGVREVTRSKQVVWEYRVDAPNEVPTCQPLPDGRVLIGIVGQCRLVEVDHAGQVVKQVPLRTTVKEPHAQFRFCRRTPEGTYLVPFTAEGVVREVDGEGQVVREFPRRPFPVAAVRLGDQHTLITTDRRVIEYDGALRVVWELTVDDVPDLNLATLAGVSRRDNGNTVICNWGTADTPDRDGAHIFEVTPDKRVVWQVTGRDLGQVAQCQVLNDDLTLDRRAGWR